MLEAEAPANNMIVFVIGDNMGKYEETFWLELAILIRNNWWLVTLPE